MFNINIFIFLLFLINGCASMQIQSGIDNLSEGNLPKAIYSFHKASSKESYKAISYLNLGKLYEKELQQYDTAYYYYTVSQKAINEIIDSKDSEIIKQELTICLSRILNHKFENLEKGKIPLKLIIFPKSIFYEESNYKSKRIGRSGFEGEEEYIVNHLENDVWFYIDDSKYVEINSIKKLLTSPDLQSKLSNIEKITAYKQFLKKHQNSEYKNTAYKRIDELSYTIAKETNSISSYSQYISDNFCPEKSYIKHANDAIEHIYFSNSNNIDSCKTYIDMYPKGKYINEVKKKFEKFYFEETQQVDTINSYLDYISKFPNGEFETISYEKITELKEFEPYQKKDTILDYFEFIKNFPNNPRIQHAKSRIEELQYEPYKENNSEIGFKAFIKEYPNSRFVDDANNRYDKLQAERVENEVYELNQKSKRIGNEFEFEFLSFKNGTLKISMESMGGVRQGFALFFGGVDTFVQNERKYKRWKQSIINSLYEINGVTSVIVH